MILRCTQKLIKTYDLSISNDISSEELLDEWYANLIYIERKKCILFTESETLYSLFLPNFKKGQIGNIEKIFKNWLKKSLKNLGIESNKIDKLLNRLDGMNYTTTQSRSILGSMNEYGYYYKHLINEEGGLQQSNIDEIVYKINGFIMGAIEYSSGNEEMRKIINNNF
ncbi:MAG: hypothetical protein K9M80_04820 [Candidatus Marinimicrobia bacterium]|nr:hypothetical protein [Candidatus Neomarinimicrobiota bacterium]